MRLGLALACGFFLVLTPSVFPHGGGLDGYGCHHNRKAGGYHCHQGQFAGQSFGSQQEMLQKASRKNSGGLRVDHSNRDLLAASLGRGSGYFQT
jgi:hypothetical protein